MQVAQWQHDGVWLVQKGRCWHCYSVPISSVIVSAYYNFVAQKQRSCSPQRTASIEHSNFWPICQREAGRRLPLVCVWLCARSRQHRHAISSSGQFWYSSPMDELMWLISKENALCLSIL